MIRSSLWALAILGILLLLQTTVLSYLVFAGVKVDLLWIVFVILAFQNGAFPSQIVGFVLGITIDTITAAPLGYNAFLFTLAGYLFGLGKGKVYLDPIVMPGLLGLIIVVYQLLAGGLLDGVFRLGDPLASWRLNTVFQALVNAALTPVVFWVFGWVRDRFQDPRRGFSG